MALTISNASFGVNSKNVKSYLDKIKSNALEKAGKQIDGYSSDFKNEVAKVWVGKGADDFVNAFKGDAGALKKKLAKLTDNLEETFNNLIKQYNNFDKNQDTKKVIK